MVIRVILVSPVKELAAAAHRSHALDEQVEVAVLAHEVERFRIHDQDGAPVEMIEKAVVAVREQGEILIGDRPLEFYPAPAHPLVQDLRLRLEVDDEIGFRSLRLERVVNLLIQVQLFARERQAREQRVLLEEKIADREPREEVHLRELAQLAYPLEKEEQLRRQREAGHILVEARQERILLRAFQDQGRVQPAGQALGEARLADADRPFDYDIVIFRERHEARARRKGRPSYTRRNGGFARDASATDRRLRRARAARRRAPGGSAGSSARAGRLRSRRTRASPRGETGAGRPRYGTPPCRPCRRKPPKACRRCRASAPSLRPAACLPPESSPECAPRARTAPRRSASATRRFRRGESPRGAARRRPRTMASRRRRRAASRRACADRRAV